MGGENKEVLSSGDYPEGAHENVRGKITMLLDEYQKPVDGENGKLFPKWHDRLIKNNNRSDTEDILMYNKHFDRLNAKCFMLPYSQSGDSEKMTEEHKELEKMFDSLDYGMLNKLFPNSPMSLNSYGAFNDFPNFEENLRVLQEQIEKWGKDNSSFTMKQSVLKDRNANRAAIEKLEKFIEEYKLQAEIFEGNFYNEMLDCFASIKEGFGIKIEETPYSEDFEGIEEVRELIQNVEDKFSFEGFTTAKRLNDISEAMDKLPAKINRYFAQCRKIQRVKFLEDSISSKDNADFDKFIEETKTSIADYCNQYNRLVKKSDTNSWFIDSVDEAKIIDKEKEMSAADYRTALSKVYQFIQDMRVGDAHGDDSWQTKENPIYFRAMQDLTFTYDELVDKVGFHTKDENPELFKTPPQKNMENIAKLLMYLNGKLKEKEKEEAK